MDTVEIQKVLPHRYPFLLIDKIINFEPDFSAHAIKCVTINEPFFQGHFPGYPVFPGVLLLEAMAQATAILDVQSNDRDMSKYLYYFVGIVFKIPHPRVYLGHSNPQNYLSDIIFCFFGFLITCRHTSSIFL